MKGKFLLEKLHANMMIDTDPFLEAPINMINLTWAEKGKGKSTWEVKAKQRQVDKSTEEAIKLPQKPKSAIMKGVVLCSKCQCKCELEVITSWVIIDQELIRRRERRARNRQKCHAGS
ncbi:hypothetical protein TB2_003382 [Malus domestica]